MSNSITKHINEHDVANRARMLRREFEKQIGKPVTIALVEGGADQLVYSYLFDSPTCKIHYSFGKANAIKALAILLRDNFRGVLAIVDDDFDSLNGIFYDNQNIIVSDTHDLETMIMLSPALEKLMGFMLPPDKQHFKERFSQEVQDALLKFGTPLGYVRWASQFKNLGLDFKNINLHTFVNKRNNIVDIRIVLDEVLSRNGNCILSRDELFSIIHKLQEKKTDPWNICQGHDLVKILIFVMPQIIIGYVSGNRTELQGFLSEVDDKIGKPKLLVERLIMCYERSYFYETRMYSQIKFWEERNKPYSIVKV